MGVEFYVSWHIEGEPQAVSIAEIRRCFGNFIVEEQTDYWFLSYDKNHFCHVLLDLAGEDACDSLAVIKPCDHPFLIRSLFNLLNLGNGVLYYPECLGPVVASDEVEAHLPPGMTDDLGPVVVASLENLIIFKL